MQRGNPGGGREGDYCGHCVGSQVEPPIDPYENVHGFGHASYDRRQGKNRGGVEELDPKCRLQRLQNQAHICGPICHRGFSLLTRSLCFWKITTEETGLHGFGSEF